MRSNAQLIHKPERNNRQLFNSKEREINVENIHKETQYPGNLVVDNLKIIVYSLLHIQDHSFSL